MKYLLCLIFITILFLFPKTYVYAESTHVLPYPSFMPGSSLYKVHLVWEKISRYWHFGNFSQFKYNLSQADKYLVESKILFEYKQYLLGYQALKKSDRFFSMIPFYLKKAEQEGKDVNQKQEIFRQAAFRHIEILKEIQSGVPEHFVWEPEKDSPTDLFLRESIQNSISIRYKLMQP